MTMPPGRALDAQVLTPKSYAPAAATQAKPSYAAERIDGTAQVLGCIKAHETSCTALAFQRSAWLRPLYEDLAADRGATATAVAVRDTVSGELAVALALTITRRGSLTVASFASLGVSDYGAPLLGPKSPVTASDAAALFTAVKRALNGCDLIELANMPVEIEGRINPLALLKSHVPARHARHALKLETTVEAFLASRGKKYRKEAERCGRLLAEKGTPEFRRAQSHDEITDAFAALESQQRQRHATLRSDYRLDQPATAHFFESALRSGTPGHTAHIFTLGVTIADGAASDQRADGEIGAVLYGISHGATFTLLRISTAGESWKRVSPGRLIVLDTMRYFLARGVNTFDFGIGDYEFKHGFGIKSEPLLDVTTALTARGLPRVLSARAKAKARQYPRLANAAKRLLGRI